MDNKKNILTLSVKRFPRRSRRLVSRVIYLRMLSMMQLRMSSAISRLVLRKSRKSLKMQRLLLRRKLTLTRFLSDVRSAS